MKITQMKINNFGKLNNKEIELGKGINLIYGKNESGKSTLLKFMEAIFYGLSKNKNGKDISDYEKYTPWKGEEFSGQIAYELDNGKRFEVFRDFRKKNPKVFDENLQEVTKRYSIDKNKGSQFFYEQVKMDEDLFLSTIVSEQQQVRLNEKEQANLVQKIANLVGTGEDNVSFEKTISKLNKRLLSQVGTNRSQDRPMNLIEQRLKELEKEKQKLQEYAQEKYILEDNEKEEKEKLKKIQKEIDFARDLNRIREEEYLQREKININKKLQSDYERKITEIEERKHQTRGKKKKAKNMGNSICLAGMILAVLVGIVDFIWLKNNIVKIIEGIAFLGFGLGFGYFIYKQKNEKRKEKEEIAILENEILMLARTRVEQNENVELLEKELNSDIQFKIEKLKSDYIEKLTQEQMNSYIVVTDLKEKIEKLQNEMNEINLSLHRLTIDKTSILPKIENLSSLQEEIESLKEQQEELEQESNCIHLAKEQIQQAYEEMKHTTTPKFTRKLSENMNQISNGKYQKIQLSDEHGLVVQTKDGNYVSAQVLSIGTIDQLYLALRLGTIEELLEERLPIFLDETFAYFDEERLENVLNFLAEQFPQRQIIIFTCSNREKRLLQRNEIPYTFIDITQ